MGRRAVFATEHVSGIRGLTALTEPDPDEPVDAIVDVAVVGARGDGKTQFIVHAIRTLRAYGPELGGAEAQHHRDIMRVVLDARAPRPDATAPGVVPHYVFRIRPAALLAGIGGMARAGLLAATTQLGAWAGAGLAAGAALGAGAALLGAALDVAALGGAGVATGAAALSARAAARRFARRGEIEVCFWDVAGEHVYSSSCADYHAFLDALVRERRRRAGARRYAFAPVLLCNPLGLGVEREGSPYQRLRQVVPLFASLDAASRVLVAVNRWSAVEALCEADRDRDEVVAVVERRRGDDAIAPAPSVRREVVRAWCRDAEDGRDDDVTITHLRYDAGTRCVIRPIEVGAATVREATVPPVTAIEYRWEDSPGAFTGPARRTFLGWLADLAYRAPAAAPEPVVAATLAPAEDTIFDAPPRITLPPLGEAAAAVVVASAPTAGAPAEVWSRRARQEP